MRGLLVMYVMRAGDLAALARHRIQTARMPRVATAETLHRQPAAVQHAESLDRLQRVIRAGRVEATPRTQKRADGPLVEANQDFGDDAHWRKRPRPLEPLRAARFEASRASALGGTCLSSALRPATS